MNQVQTEVIFLNLLRQADEFIFSILGMNPTPDAGSFRARVSALFEMFNADKYNFVLSPVHLGFLATLIKEYEAFRKSEITQIGTPEILIGQIRWEDIYDKPDIVGGSSDWADITNKPATFAPSAHAHDYASITDKPTTFAPSAHAHDYASITDKPADFPAQFTTVSYVGNGNASRNISYTPAVAIRAVIARRTDGGCFLWWDGLDSLLSFATAGIMAISSMGWNASGQTYTCLLLW